MHSTPFFIPNFNYTYVCPQQKCIWLNYWPGSQALSKTVKERWTPTPAVVLMEPSCYLTQTVQDGHQCPQLPFSLICFHTQFFWTLNRSVNRVWRNTTFFMTALSSKQTFSFFSSDFFNVLFTDQILTQFPRGTLSLCPSYGSFQFK